MAYVILDDLSELSDALASKKYDIVFTDKEMENSSLSTSGHNLAIITTVNSKDEVAALIKKQRG